MYGVLAIPLAGIAAIIIINRARNKKRREALSAPFPAEWERFLEKNVPVYRRIPAEMKEKLRELIKLFIFEKTFEGCAGLELTDEIKVTIAGQACMLLLERGKPVYPALDSILVYPGAFISENVKDKEGYFSDAEVHIGEAWRTGVIILAWDEVKHGARDPMDGHNVVLHEFAHKLDQEGSITETVPQAKKKKKKDSSFVSWARVLSSEFAYLQEETEGGLQDLIDSYGATNMAEFFAVATETFFEKPVQMRKKHPELFEVLEGYYGIDPSEWLPQGGKTG